MVLPFLTGCGNRVVRPRLDGDVVGRVGVDQLHLLAVEELVELVRIGRVAA